MNSFFSDAIASWNLLMEIFNYKDLVRPKSKSVFKIHDPAGLRNPFQLRESLSHILCYNFIDQGNEDTSNFLFSCPSYAIQRVH